MDIEIEEPTEEQQIEAVMGQAVRMAGRAAWDTEIIAYLVSQSMPKKKAKSLIPEIRERGGPLKRRYFARKRLIGYILVLSAAAICVGVFFTEGRKLTVPVIVVSIIPLFAGLNQIFASRTPKDEELGLPEKEESSDDEKD